MEDKNIRINLFIKQLNKSNALAYNKDYVASHADYNFKILDNAYEGTGELYAKLKSDIENNSCEDPTCFTENQKLKIKKKIVCYLNYIKLYLQRTHLMTQLRLVWVVQNLLKEVKVAYKKV